MRLNVIENRHIRPAWPNWPLVSQTSLCVVLRRRSLRRMKVRLSCNSLHALICSICLSKRWVIQRSARVALVDERDTRGMAGHMAALIRDASYAANLGAAGRLRSSEELGLEGRLTQLRAVIHEAINMRAGR